ncbi:phage tail assembly chaperone [Ochrobactrum chromiisoli]|uniref:Uncharacterized protein n=1 Tax=Ochrobactrum chromiisoli TaxID=2993941 RepID=A0ABT3QUP1_9HYPH|nr:hypothetical protein [Ochrobactrum chromiisoli]MCX2699257.1 hypothetical protein [Ochrobactrum chromiisoli]
MDFQINEVAYRSGKMNAMTQFHVSRRMAPLLSSLTEIAQGGKMDVPSVLSSLMNEISKLSDTDCEYVLYACMAVTSRDQGGGRGYASILAGDGKTSMFPDIDMLGMLTIAAHVLQDNLAGFFPSSVLTSGGDMTAPPSNG